MSSSSISTRRAAAPSAWASNRGRWTYRSTTLLDRNCRVEDVILKTSVPDLELLPSNIDLSAAELMLVNEVAREQTLLRVLAPLRVKYDFILIDCPPS